MPLGGGVGIAPGREELALANDGDGDGGGGLGSFVALVGGPAPGLSRPMDATGAHVGEAARARRMNFMVVLGVEYCCGERLMLVMMCVMIEFRNYDTITISSMRLMQIVSTKPALVCSMASRPLKISLYLVRMFQMPSLRLLHRNRGFTSDQIRHSMSGGPSTRNAPQSLMAT